MHNQTHVYRLTWGFIGRSTSALWVVVNLQKTKGIYRRTPIIRSLIVTIPKQTEIKGDILRNPSNQVPT